MPANKCTTSILKSNNLHSNLLLKILTCQKKTQWVQPNLRTKICRFKSREQTSQANIPFAPLALAFASSRISSISFASRPVCSHSEHLKVPGAAYCLLCTQDIQHHSGKLDHELWSQCRVACGRYPCGNLYHEQQGCCYEPDLLAKAVVEARRRWTVA